MGALVARHGRETGVGNSFTLDLVDEAGVRSRVELAQAAGLALEHPAPREILQRGHPLCRWAGIPERPGYWWTEHGPEPDRAAYFTLNRAAKPGRTAKRSEPPRWDPPKLPQPS